MLERVRSALKGWRGQLVEPVQPTPFVGTLAEFIRGVTERFPPDTPVIGSFPVAVYVDGLRNAVVFSTVEFRDEVLALQAELRKRPAPE